MPGSALPFRPGPPPLPCSTAGMAPPPRSRRQRGPGGAGERRPQVPGGTGGYPGHGGGLGTPGGPGGTGGDGVSRRSACGRRPGIRGAGLLLAPGSAEPVPVLPVSPVPTWHWYPLSSCPGDSTCRCPHVPLSPVPVSQCPQSLCPAVPSVTVPSHRPSPGPRGPAARLPQRRCRGRCHRRGHAGHGAGTEQEEEIRRLPVHGCVCLTLGGPQRCHPPTPWPCPYQPCPLICPHVPAGLSYPVFKGIMKKGYKVPTPIQRKVRPWGCGGTFGIPPPPWGAEGRAVSRRPSR